VLQLTAAPDKLQLVTGQAATIDVHCSYVDHTLSGDNVEGTRQNTAITTATTTDILAAPASGVVRRVKILTIRNKHASAWCIVTVVYDANGTDFELHQEFLRPGDSLQYHEMVGFFRTLQNSRQTAGVSTADQAITADTYLTGSAIAVPATQPVAVGTVFRWTFSMARAASAITTAAQFLVRFGTAGSVADTARLTFNGLTAQTNATDQGFCRIQAIVRGPIGASCIVSGSLDFEHHNATTGLFNQNHIVQSVTSAAFDITTAGMIVGVSCNPQGVSWTFQQVTAEPLNLY